MFCSGKQKGEAEVEWNPADSIGCSACRGGHRRRHVTGCACSHALPSFESLSFIAHCCSFAALLYAQETRRFASRSFEDALLCWTSESA